MFIFVLVLHITFAYDGQCNFKCDTCFGPNVTDCIGCVEHATMNSSFICICDRNWAGPDWSTYVGQCHPRCVGCSGPNRTDCDFWVQNAIYTDQFGCVCNFGWGDDDCSVLLSGNAQAGCAKICKGWIRGKPHECLECTDNAGFDSRGRCKCNPGWGGEDCNTYMPAYCDPRCETCNGPTNYECDTCVIHSVKDISGACVCSENWYGPDCQLYTPHKNDCDPICTGGCTGPSKRDCAACVVHARYNDLKEECECFSGWSGEDCSIPNLTACDPMCKQCVGPSRDQCVEWVQNAILSGNSCHCKDQWNGGDCSIWSGPCNPKCFGGCTGPESSQCNACQNHAVMNQVEVCVCDEFWTGDDCSVFRGDCNSICYTCYGPSELDCKYCVPHAFFDAQGACRCEHSWTGGDCTLFDGKCDSKCAANTNCTGPSAGDCEKWVENARFDDYDYCMCVQSWSGSACQVYVGTCDPKCIGCDGPGDHSCRAWVPNAVQDIWGACVCLSGWEGTDCSQYVQSCHIRCDGCTGPSEFSCISCVKHADRNSMQACVCQENWSPPNCTLFSGHCDPKCVDCNGPFANDCTSCVAHALPDEYNYCVCENNWGGNDCSLWNGQCDPKCELCDGPNACNCGKCVLYASHDANGCCRCNEFWGGDSCSVFTGPCNSKCMQEYGCTSIDASHCNLCNMYATWDDDKVCQCNPDRSGSDCAIYIGLCHSLCQGCTGPSHSECKQCVQNARWDSETTCHWEANWTGMRCDIYSGLCSQRCHGSCIGPLASDWLECILNAEVSHHTESCECNQDWSGAGCEIFIGTCPERCEVCQSPTKCSLCLPNTGMNEDHQCVCEEGWQGRMCEQWIGVCHLLCAGGCFGPTSTDCNSCIENAKSSMLGECVCSEHWDGDFCLTYVGPCDPLCEGCHAPGPQGCDACQTNAYRDSTGTCTCGHDYDENWISYTGRCHPTCAKCSGPNSDDCLTCVSNAERTTNKECFCRKLWTSPSCDVYIGSCSPLCIAWAGLNQCLSCDKNSILVDGICNWAENYTDESCSTYIGKCDSVCETCTGPQLTDCITCSPNAYRNSQGLCVCMNQYNADWTTYVGICPPLCPNQCSSPNYCEKCASNSTMQHGVCECKDDWSGSSCNVYTGECHLLCSGCRGPTSFDCFDCTANAMMTSNGCECMPQWFGHEWEVFDQEKCDPACQKCQGPEICTICKPNAVLTREGHCECYSGWVGEDCAVYTGRCDSKCESCNGPSILDCTKCIDQAEIDAQGLCQCSSDWTGAFCTQWKGVCHPKCKGCHGPLDYDCDVCISNAFKASHSDIKLCECRPEFTGEACETSILSCHISCGGNDNCDPYIDPTVCTSCAEGYALVGGTCQLCHNKCLTCLLEDINLCTSCFDGFYAHAGDCLQCDASCTTCIHYDTCVTCFDDSYFDDGICLCKWPTVRNPTTNLCMESCPTGFQANAYTNLCEEMSSQYKAVSFDFTISGPWTSTGRDNSVTASYCNPPRPIQDRGIHFDGTQTLAVEGFYFHSQFTFGIWAHPKQGNASLLSYDYSIWEGWDEWDRDTDDQFFEHLFSTLRSDALYISNCNNYKLVSDLQDKEHQIEPIPFSLSEWHYFGVSQWSDFSKSTKKLHLNKSQSHIISDDAVITGPPDGTLYIGSIGGLIKFFEGFIWEFDYYTYADAEEVFGTCSGLCHNCPQGGCIPTCDFNQYIDVNGYCSNCHPSCLNGCSDFHFCGEENPACHSDCLTCNGPLESNCTSCKCNATLLNGKCVCEEGFNGQANQCKINCFAGCDVCTSPEPDDCLRCNDNYHLVKNDLVMNAQGYCEWCFEDLYDKFPTCGAQEKHDEIEECMCEPGQWFDFKSKVCRHCSSHCADCDDNPTYLDTSGMHCKRCDKSYHFLKDSDICTSTCPTGYTKHVASQSCIGSGQYVIDFFFKMTSLEAIHRNWIFKGSSVDKETGSHIEFETSMYGGDRAVAVEADDPFILDDRGLWFNGTSHYLSVRGLTLNHSMALSSWLKPFGAGTLISTSSVKQSAYDYERSLFWSLGAYSFEWGDTYHHSHTNFNAVNLYEWQHSSVELIWEQGNQHTIMTFSKNLDEQVQKTTFNFITLDFPENAHIIGAMKKGDTIMENYKGFIYMFRVHNGGHVNSKFTEEIVEDCQECSICPLKGCLGVCNWNFYSSLGRCERCPKWCESGCQSDGTC